MTLLELLVKELPCRGGWPMGIEKISQSPIDGELYLFKSCEILTGRGIYFFEVSDLCGIKVHKRQYEAAIAAQQPAWNGEGLPPVGVDVEFILDTDKYSAQGNIPENGQTVSVVAHKVTTDGNEVAVVYWDDKGAGRGAAFIKQAFRPIRTEAERKREEVAESLIRFLDSKTDIDNVFRTSDVMGFIDYVAAGKIPGVEISK